MPLRALTAEFVGTAFLLATVIGSGIMADALSPDDAVALLGNTLLFGETPLPVLANSDPDDMEDDDFDATGALLSEEEPEVVSMIEKLKGLEEDFDPAADPNTMEKPDKKKWRQVKSDITRLKEKIGKKAKSPEVRKKYTLVPTFNIKT